MSTSAAVSSALDSMYERPGGLYGELSALPIISQKGHERRIALLDGLDIGDVRGATCVDFGIGAWGFGAVYPRLKDCARAIGMDISAEALAQSRRLVESTQPTYASVFETMSSDGSRLPLDNASVDIFFAGESIEHVRFPRLFVSEVHRVLKPNGQFVLTTPNKNAVLYSALGEEYCTSPEHFWLFDTDELKDVLSEYFHIAEWKGFNGSIGPGLDRVIHDDTFAEEWASKYADEPELACGIVARCIKRPDVKWRYVVGDIGPTDISVSNADRYLDLEFGLKGLLLDRKGARVEIRRPPSSGLVCRFWQHRWSGYAQIEDRRGSRTVDLYARDPGWKNWTSNEPTRRLETVVIRPAFQKRNSAELDQVIFFEAFTWDVVPL